MELINTLEKLRQKLSEYKHNQQTIGLVPTMGALHQGHLSLISFLKPKANVIITSIFVNPTQFGPNEDFQKYPRALSDDCKKLENSGCDIVFAPSVLEMYPHGFETFVDVGSVSKGLCGDLRPGHFRGVATIVLKLFMMTQADFAVFGEKDYQQLQVIQQMAKDLNIPITILSLPTVRENDGLAMSSRNQYLSNEQRQTASKLFEGLHLMKDAILSGKQNPLDIVTIGKNFYSRFPQIQLQYLEIREKDYFAQSPLLIEKDVIILIAAFIGQTRLIDNIVVSW